jgi:WD40 repeat protein
MLRRLLPLTLLLFTAPASARDIRVLSGHRAAVIAVAFRPDGEQLASASFDHTLRVWDAATGDLVCCCRGHHDKVTALAYHPEGSLLASAGLDHSLRLWNAATGRRVLTLATGERAVQALCFSPDGRHLLAAGDSGAVEVIDLGTRRVARRLTLTHEPLYALALSPDGTTLAASGHGGTVHVVSLKSGERLQTLPGFGDVYSLCFSGTGERLLSGGEDGVRVWDVTRGRLLAQHEQHAGVYQVGCSPDGRRIVSAGADGEVQLRDAESGAILHAHRFPGKALCAAIAPDGRQVGLGTEKARCYLMELPPRAR